MPKALVRTKSLSRAKPLGRALRALRQEAGLTRFALAKAARLDPAALSRIEGGSRVDVRFSAVCQLAAALGISVDEIALRAGLLNRKGVPHGRVKAQRAALAHGLRSLERVLVRATATIERLRSTLSRRT